jgi:hypothetical protein
MFGTTYFRSPSIATPFPDGLVDEVVQAPATTAPSVDDRADDRADDRN